MTLVVNLIGGPGTGKSTTAAETFALLKHEGVNAELVTEYAKDLVWGRTTATLDNQIYIFAKQYHRIFRLVDQVDVIVTDAPIFLSLYYGRHLSNAYRQLVIETFRSYDNLTFLLRRVKEFNPKGRLQTEDEARAIDRELVGLVDKYDVPTITLDADRTAAREICKLALSTLETREWYAHERG